MNQVNLLGRLTKNPETKSFSKEGKNISICNFSLAINESNDRTTFINCVAFGKLADNLAKYKEKGEMIAVSGKISNDNYQKEDGSTVYSFKVIANEIQFLPSNKSNSKENEDFAIKETEEDDFPF